MSIATKRYKIRRIQDVMMRKIGTYIVALMLINALASGFNVVVANEKPTLSYLQFACEPDANFFSLNSLDFHADKEPSPQREDVFRNSFEKDNPENTLKVTTCVVNGMELSLDRVFLNAPNNSGNLCATLDWAVYQLKADSKLVSEFISGCSDEIHLFTTRFNLHMCKSDFNETACMSLAWQDIAKDQFSPIRIGLIGNWL